MKMACCFCICFGSDRKTIDCLHFNKLYKNKNELLVKAKESAHIPPLTGSMPYLGSQSSVVQNTDTSTDEEAIYALFEAVAEDCIWNINKLSQLDHKLKSTTSKKNHSTPLPVHLSLHDASPCPPESLTDVSNPTTNMQGIHDPEFCVEVVISTPLQIPSALTIFNSAPDSYPQVLQDIPFSFPVHLQCFDYKNLL